MMNYYKKSMVAIAITMGMSMTVIAEEASKEVKEDEVEIISVFSRGTIFSNTSLGNEQKQLQSSVTSVMGMVDNLASISIEEGDAFGSDDWSSMLSMRGFSINLNDQALGITVEGMTNGGSKANRFLIGAPRTAIFNVTVGL